MRSGYGSFADEGDMMRQLGKLSPKTIIIDIEPLVAYWDGSQQALDRGIAVILDRVQTIPGVMVVCFSTNSARRPSEAPNSTRVRVVYLASADKPARIAPYQHFPLPGVVVGDQVLTDGILARRLNYTFLHYRPELAGRAPLGPALLSGSGRLIRPLLFRQEGLSEPGESRAVEPYVINEEEDDPCRT